MKYVPKYIAGDPDGLNYMRVKNVDEYLNDYAGKLLLNHLRDFFDTKSAQSCLKDNDFYELFDSYKKFVSPIWLVSLDPLTLAHFLYLLDIDACIHLNKEQIKELFGEKNLRYFN